MLTNYDDLICYEKIEIDHHGKLKTILEKHSTKEGTWGLLQLNFGEFDFIYLDGSGNELSRYQINSTNPGVHIPPAIWHRIEPISEEFSAILAFYCYPHRYFNKKYDLDNVHGDLYYVFSTYLKDKDNLNILDIGCGHGRNLLFLALYRHLITGIDIKKSSINNITEIAINENMTNVGTLLLDLNQPTTLQLESYNVVISLNCLQFLEAQRIPSLLTELQLATLTNGLHLLIFPIRSEPYSFPSIFTYLAKSMELHNFYQDRGWSILEYKESVEQLYKLDASGKPIQGLFGFLLAQKT